MHHAEDGTAHPADARMGLSTADRPVVDRIDRSTADLAGVATPRAGRAAQIRISTVRRRRNAGGIMWRHGTTG